MRSLCVHQEIRATGAQGARLLGFFYEKTRGRCRTFSVSLRLLRCSLPLRFAQPGRNRADSMPASRALRPIQLGAPAGDFALAPS